MIFKILFWLGIILAFGIALLTLAIIHYVKVCNQFIKDNNLEEYTDKGEWLNWWIITIS